jgi:2-phosphosulfolactate phosphatase
MHWHLIPAEAGCHYAVEHNCVAIIVDALRASATAAMLLDAGATELIVVREVYEARAAKDLYRDALLYGERGGLPPDGFDYGNSPREARHAAGRRVIFTTTTGAGRLVAAWGAATVYMGTTINATAVARAAATHGKDVVVIPAGLTGDPDYDAQEDWTAAAAVLMAAGDITVSEGAAEFAHWRNRINSEGLEHLFNTAPHAENLRQIGHTEDIAWCAQRDITEAVPLAKDRDGFGIRVERHK